MRAVVEAKDEQITALTASLEAGFWRAQFEEVNCPGRIDRCYGRSEGLFAAVEYLVVDRALIKIREHRLCLFWHVGSLVVRAHECLH